MKRWFIALIACLAVCSSGENLIPNANFKLSEIGTDIPMGWKSKIGNSAVQVGIDRKVTYQGSSSLRMSLPHTPNTERSWHMVACKVPKLRANTPYTISVVMKAELVGDSMAYFSLNCFTSSGNRLAANDSPSKAMGTTDWKRYSFTLPKLPSGTSEAQIVLCLYGWGTVWYTHIQVEEGDKLTPFTLCKEDLKTERQQALIREKVKQWQAENLKDRRFPQRDAIAILDLGLKAEKCDAGFPADPKAIQRVLSKSYDTFILSGDDVCNRGIFSADTFKLLIVPTGSYFPAKATKVLSDFLDAGGNLITCGGYAFDVPVVNYGGQWKRIGTMAFAPLDKLEKPVSVQLPKLVDWRYSHDRNTQMTISELPDGGTMISTELLHGWSNGLGTFPQIDSEWSAVSVVAKGGPNTPNAWFELTEKDGSRWRAKLPLTEEWKEYVLTLDKFTYWYDNPSIGRGGKSDLVKPENVLDFSYGCSVDSVQRGRPHAAAIKDLKLGQDPLKEQRLLRSPQINTRDGRIRDAIHMSDTQIGIFDPCFELLDVASVQTSPEMQGIFPDVSLSAPVSGLSAVAQQTLSGHGFGPSRACWRPLLECKDARGNHRGHAGAIAHHHSGYYKGSTWAFFGVDNMNLFEAGSPMLEDYLPKLVDALTRNVWLNHSGPEFACYKKGETMKLMTRVLNSSRAVRKGQVRFTLKDEKDQVVFTQVVPYTAEPKLPVDVSTTWLVPEKAPDFMYMSAELLDNETVIDREINAVCIWNPELIARGPVLKRDGLRLTIDGEARFFMGCQNYWGQNNTVTARSPLNFYRDFKMMREYGLRWSRCFLPFKDEISIRVSDAVVQLAQRFGIVIYHTPNLSNTPDEGLLAQEQKTMTAIAQRYKDVPGFAIDICNEPAMRMDTSIFEKAFGKQPKFAGEWSDAKVNETFSAATRFQHRWAMVLRAAAKQVRPEVNVSVGWSQGWAGGRSTKDPQIASLDLDFTDRHYYGPYERMVPHLKDVDLRILGKPVIMGECGAKCHPTFHDHDPWGHGDDDKEYNERFRYLVSHVFGSGATAMLSWHWRDPMEGIFPCGLVLCTWVPRPTASVYGKMARTFGQLKLVDNPPDTLILLGDYLRHSVLRSTQVTIANRTDAALMWQGSNYSKLTESALEQAVATGRVKTIVYPGAFVMSETTVQLLERFVKGGGVLFITGAPVYDDKATVNASWLERLCGVSLVPNTLKAPFENLPRGNFGTGLLSNIRFAPSLEVTLKGAKTLEQVDGKVALTEYAVGKGKVFFSPSVFESDSGNEEGIRVLYGTILQEGKAFRTRRDVDPATLETFKVPGEKATGWVFWNNDDKPVKAERQGHSVTVGPKRVGYLQIADDGKLEIAEEL